MLFHKSEVMHDNDKLCPRNCIPTPSWNRVLRPVTVLHPVVRSFCKAHSHLSHFCLMPLSLAEHLVVMSTCCFSRTRLAHILHHCCVRVPEDGCFPVLPEEWKHLLTLPLLRGKGSYVWCASPANGYVGGSHGRKSTGAPNVVTDSTVVHHSTASPCYSLLSVPLSDAEWCGTTTACRSRGGKNTEKLYWSESIGAVSLKSEYTLHSSESQVSAFTNIAKIKSHYNTWTLMMLMHYVT